MQGKYRDKNDETLVLLTLAGEQSAYEMLVIRYEKAALAAARSVIGNAELARDAAQDAFITAWMKLNCLREPGKYGPWVCRIAGNCARNMAARFRSFLSLDELEERAYFARPSLSEDGADERGPLFSEPSEDPAGTVIRQEEKELLWEKMEILSERIKTVLRMHYFGGLSVAEIAGRLGLSEGTVKWQLHDGRKKLRKELSAMDERENDTLPVRVMKKVEELKCWKRMKRKTGFAEVYREVLAELDGLPTSRGQQSALADVLLLGWWWLPEKEKDSEALLARVRDAAEKGRNEEVISFLAAKEDEKFYGDTRIAFIRDKQIPRLTKAGYLIAAGKEWFWLGMAYFRKNNPAPEDEEAGMEALRKAASLLPPSHLYHALACAAAESRKNEAQKLMRELSARRYQVRVSASEFRRVGDRVCRTDEESAYIGGDIYTSDCEAWNLFFHAALCDGELTTGTLTPGERFVGSDGSTLLYEGKQPAVTPAGRFEECLVFLCKDAATYDGESGFRTFLAPGVGIVRQEHLASGFRTVTELTDYALTGKGSLPSPIPFSKGNRFTYRRAGVREEVLSEKIVCEVVYADEERAILSTAGTLVRLRYDEDSWLDMIEQIRGEYWQYDEESGEKKLVDISPVIARAEALAVTPVQKAHTRAAASVARRIYRNEKDPAVNAGWNFFQRWDLKKDGEQLRGGSNFRWSFEWKCYDNRYMADMMVNNDLLGILEDDLGFLWSERFRDGYHETVERFLYGDTVTTEVCAQIVPEVETPAGRFAGCLKLSLDTKGFPDGLAYRGGKRAYYFAPGIGIVKMEVDGIAAVGDEAPAYLLTSYKGEGAKDEYFPVMPGMERRYEAPGLPGGYVCAAEYIMESDEEGNTVIFEDRTGYRRVESDALFYDDVWYEKQEERLWDAKKHEEARLRQGIDNFYLAMHFLTRQLYHRGFQKKAVAWRRSCKGVAEALFAPEGEISPGLLGFYGRLYFHLCCPLFGCLMEDQEPGEQADAIREEAYGLLERSIALLEKWYAIPDGSALEVGNPDVFGGIRVVKGEDTLLTPDGRREMLPDYDIRFALNPGRGDLLYGMTAPRGCEWFNPVREEERFKTLTEIVRKKNL